MNKINQIKLAAEQLIRPGNMDIIDKVFSSGYKAHAGDKTYNGHKFIKQFAKQIQTAIPDIKLVNIEILTQSRNIITWQRTFSGTHKEYMKGIPASNKKVKWYEIVVTRFNNGKIVEEWVASDLAFQLMLKQASRK